MNTEPTRTSFEFLAGLTAIVLITLSLSELAFQYQESESFNIIGRFSFVMLGLCMATKFKFREWVLVATACLLVIGLQTKENGLSDIWAALDKAAFFAAFIYLVTLLKEAAARSQSVLELGSYLTHQPPGRRYYSLAFGGHALGVLLNFGAISLLTPLIQRGARTAKTPQLVADQEQQQISALLRGFSWILMWSPTALTQAVLFSAFPQINLKIVIPLGIFSTIIMILLGRFEDRIRWQKTPKAIPANVQFFPVRAAIKFLVVCLVLVSLTTGVIILGDVTAAIALMLVAPFVMTIWIFEQEYNQSLANALSNTTHSLTQVLGQSSAVLGRNAVTLGLAGFIGEAAARLAPIDVLANYLDILNVPPWLLLISFPVIINLCGQIALSPILVVVFLCSIINQLPVLPVDPNLIVFALGAGWALSMTASPNASATLLISGISGIAPTTLTWKWNGIYSLMCFAVFSIMFVLLTRWF